MKHYALFYEVPDSEMAWRWLIPILVAQGHVGNMRTGDLSYVRGILTKHCHDIAEYFSDHTFQLEFAQ